MPRHEIRIRFDGDNAALTIDGKTIDLDSSIAAIITNSITTYLGEWFMPTESDGATYIAPTSTMKVRVTKSKDEVEFVIEE